MSFRELRVLAVTDGIAGAYCSKLFADAGADVVLGEPVEGTPLRRWSASGRRPDGEDGALFRFLHTSQRSVTDWRPLVDAADVLVTDRLHTGRELAAARRPGQIVVTVTPFGIEGPWADRAATEFTLQAWCGSTGSRGTPDTPPLAAGGRIGLWVAGTYAGLTGIAASFRARQTGVGEHVDVSMLEAMSVTMNTYAVLFASFTGWRTGAALPRSIEIPSIEPTADGWVGFCTITAQQFQDFLVLIERPDLVDDKDLATAVGRFRRMNEFVPLIHAWTRQRATEEVIEQASLLRIPVTPIGNGENVTTFEHFQKRGVFVENPGGGFLQPRTPYTIDGRPPSELRPAPGLGDTPVASTGWARRDAAPDEPRDAPLPLHGIRVVDFTAFWAGPAASQALAALGADVVKIESIQRPDGMRFTTVRPPSVDQWWEWGPVFHGANSGKRSVTLDLNREEGRDLVRRLIGGADAVIENFTPRVLDGFGLDWPAVRAVNPRCVMVRMPAFGLDGPWRDRTGFAQTVEQVSGLAWVTGWAGGPPLIPRGACDPLAGMHAALAMIVALDRRADTGEGALVEVPLVEAALNAAAEQVVEHGAYGVVLDRHGNDPLPGTRLQGLFPCAGEEQWIAVAVEDDAQDAALRAVVGDDLAGWCASRDPLDAARELLAAGVPAGAVVRPQDIVDNPQLRARGFFEPLDHPVVGAHGFPSLPFLFRSTGGRRWLRSPAPTLGQHNDEVLGGELGLDADELERLRAEGVVGERPAGV